MSFVHHLRRTLLLPVFLSACLFPAPPGGDDDDDDHTNTITNTVTVTVPVPDDDPDPGHFQAPLVELTQVFDDNGALGENGALQFDMHLDEVRYRASDAKLFYCSYTWGVIDASEPLDATYLAQGYDWKLPSPVLRDTGCIHLDWSDDDPDITFADHRGNFDFHPHLTAIDLQTVITIEDGDQDGIGAADADGDTSDDVETTTITPLFGPSLFEDGVSYEGMDWANGHLFVAIHAGGIGVYDYHPVTLEMSRIAESEGIVPNAVDIHVVDTTAYVVDQYEGLFVLDVSDVNNITEISRLYIGGIGSDVRYDNDFVYIAAGTAGLAIVDVADPASPALVSLTPAHSAVTRIGVHDNRVAVAGFIDTRVYDVTDKTHPAIIGGVRIETEKTYDGDEADERPDVTARVIGVDLFEDFLFVGDWWVPYTYQIFADRPAPYIVLPEDVAYMSVGTVDVGSTGTYAIDLHNDGNAELSVYDAWATNPAFTVDPPYAVISPDGTQEFTITYTPTGDTEETALVHFLSDDPNQVLRQGYVVGNPSGIGVGDPFPLTLGTDVVTDLTWDSALELADKVSVITFFATFWPTSALELPDLQATLVDVYGDEIEVVAIDPDTQDSLDLGAVAAFAANHGVTYPVVSQNPATSTYSTIEAVYDGASTYPFVIILDRHGMMRYIAREYDSIAMQEVIELLLDEP